MPELAATLERASARRDPARGYGVYAWAVLGFNLLVILWGAFVRATGSGAGCGSHWPLCNGEVVPRAPATATLIEFGHRVSSGLALLLITGLVIGAWRWYRRGHPVRTGAAWSGVFIVSEALIGAGLVLFEYVAGDTRVARAYWVGGHLINTFLLVGALALTAWWATGGPPLRVRGAGRRAMPLLAALVGVLLLGVSGAVTALGDTLFPASSLAAGEAQTFSQSAHLFVRLRVWHPALALAVGALVCAAALGAAAGPSLARRRLAWLVGSFYAGQLLIGLLNLWMLAPVGLQVLHLLLSDAIWIALVLLTAATLASDPPAT